ncbi:hypothetical protein REC12_12720 [Desulfosporosinus sp. PR]|nr:hypothetical protein [Desulfosporosinus sp. PR]
MSLLAIFGFGPLDTHVRRFSALLTPAQTVSLGAGQVFFSLKMYPAGRNLLIGN